MYYKNYSFLLLTHVITFSLCFNNKYHATATFINNNFITPGSTILVNWADSNYNNTIDIQLIERNYVENKSNNNDTTPSNNHLSIIAQLATNVTSTTKLYPVEIPISILSTTTYSIIISKKGTNLASSGPLKTLNSSTTKDSNNNTAIILLSSINAVTSSNKTLPLSVLVADNNSSNTSQVTSSQYMDDIGPTLTSTQVAAIAMGFIGCSGVIFVVYFTFKWIKERRALQSEKRIRERNQQQHQFIIHHDTTSLSSTDYLIPETTTAINNRSAGSSSAHNGKAKKFFTLENINEEDNLYYLEPDSNKNNLKFDSLGPAPRQQRSSSPFGEPPQTFNGNRYTVDNNYSIIPPPPNAYPHQ